MMEDWKESGEGAGDRGTVRHSGRRVTCMSLASVTHSSTPEFPTLNFCVGDQNVGGIRLTLPLR